MKVLCVDSVRKAVRDLCIQAGTRLPDDVLTALAKASETEDSPLGKEVLGAIVKNANLAKETKIPICQDTGVTYVFLELGQDLHLWAAIFVKPSRRASRKVISKAILGNQSSRTPVRQVEHWRQHSTGNPRGDRSRVEPGDYRVPQRHRQ